MTNEQPHRTLCLKALTIFKALEHGQQDELINEWIAELMAADEQLYIKNPADAFTRRFTEER